MKKTQKIINAIMIIFIFMFLFIFIFINNYTYAVNNIINKDILTKNITKYTNGEKIVAVTLDNGDEIMVGNFDAENDPIDTLVTDNNIQLKSSSGTINIAYEIFNDKCLFSISETIDMNVSEDELLVKVIAPKMLSICFLSVTDEYGINSENALKYYEEKLGSSDFELSPEQMEDGNFIDASKLIIEQQKNVNDSVFSYTNFQKEYIKETKYTYLTKLEIKFDNLNNINKNNINNNLDNNLNNNQNNNQNNNSNINSNNVIKDNTTIGQNKLPQTGYSKMVIYIILFILVISIILYIKIKKINLE